MSTKLIKISTITTALLIPRRSLPADSLAVFISFLLLTLALILIRLLFHAVFIRLQLDGFARNRIALKFSIVTTLRYGICVVIGFFGTAYYRRSNILFSTSEGYIVKLFIRMKRGILIREVQYITGTLELRTRDASSKEKSAIKIRGY